MQRRLTLAANHPPSQKRRSLLALISATPATSLLLPRQSVAQAAPEVRLEWPHVRATLAAIVDHLLPADELSPSGTSLGVDRQIRELAGQVPLYARLIVMGCEWLDEQAGQEFHTLPEEVGIELLEWTEGLPFDAFPRRMIEMVRSDAMRYYYAQPAAWPGLPVTRPPQPVGYSLD